MIDDILSAAPPARLGLSEVRLGLLSAVLRREIDAGLLPGAVSLVARRGQVAHFESCGRLDPAGGVSMQRDAIFRIYSMTKPVVSVAALMLAEEGRLHLQEPISTWLPEFRNLSVGIESDHGLSLQPVEADITVLDLLRHTSGLTYGHFGSHAVQRLYNQAGIGEPDADSAEQCARLARLPLLSQPGAAWAYGHSTDVLGRVIEVIAGQPLSRILQHRIFAPLGMKDTGFHVPLDQQHRIAEPHAVDPQGGEPVKLLGVRSARAFESGGGGLVSTAGDFALFLQCLLNGGNLGGVRLLGHKTVEWMVSDHLGNLPALGDVLPPGHGFGLGFAVRRAAGLSTLPGSAGLYYWGGIAGTTFFVDPAEQLFAILMIQAPMQRLRYRALFRQLVYAALSE